MGVALPDTAPEGPYVALEKIHGAQLVLGFGVGDMLHVGKRKAWLDPEEPFFGWQLVRPRLEEAARALRAEFERNGLLLPGADLVLYGELYGGGYPHGDVPRVNAFSPIQTGIWYAPDLHWSPFAALVAQPDDEGGELLALNEWVDLAGAVGLMLPPVLARGPRAELIALPERFLSRVSARHHLPPLTQNVAEGYVLWLDRRMPLGRPMAAKRKIPEMREADFDGSRAFDPLRALPLADLLTLVPLLVGRARLESARSKVGPHSLKALLDEVELDVFIDLEGTLPAALSALPREEAAHLARAVRLAAAGLMRGEHS
ncbi:RNA ligase family protein [Deinococcus hopiensis]|uniref:RNA ligase, Rnl2 family n=1 Tax=Deinococcus hopiensis KR-140 TaxID=695939 RepID=A0A1W1UPG3_9DEIO|nr:RNA ligase family protein [Deinococcus hopiensis]SMB82879.1 RNA ligase, Rnl2 family [Deinococcus hopiensis KR-140]